MKRAKPNKEDPVGTLTRAERSLAIKATNRLLATDRREFRSSSSPGKVYVAMIMADGQLSCDCPGWTIKKAGKPRQCKHTAALAAGRPTVVNGDYLYVKELAL